MDITVILCTYNPTIEELVITLDSIVNQRDVSFEIVISDDGSKDNHKEFIETVKTFEYIHYVEEIY